MKHWIPFAAAVLAAPALRAGEPPDAPRPLPLTRPDMKQLLEDMKQRTPRIPLPPLTDEERAKLGFAASCRDVTALGPPRRLRRIASLHRRVNGANGDDRRRE